MNEWTHFFMKIYLSHFILKKGWCWLCVWGVLEMGTDSYILTQVLLTIAALLPHSGWAAQLWVTESRKPSVCKLILSLASCPPNDSNCNWNCNSNWLKPSMAPGYIIVWHPPASCIEFNHVHRSRWYSNIFDQMHLFHCSSAYLHRCISWLMARSIRSSCNSLKNSPGVTSCP